MVMSSRPGDVGAGGRQVTGAMQMEGAMGISRWADSDEGEVAKGKSSTGQAKS